MRDEARERGGASETGLRTGLGKRVSFLVNGNSESAMAIRARSFCTRLPDYDIGLVYRDAHKVRAIWTFLRNLLRHKPVCIYVFDMAFSGVIAGLTYSVLSGARLVIDTGDAIGFLAESSAERGWIGRKLTHLLELVSTHMADALVVRSQFHAEYLRSSRQNVEVIPDGVDIEEFKPGDSEQLRRELGLTGFVAVGLLGSLTWSRRWRMCYGWELVGALAALRDVPVKGLIVGDGNGLEWLKQHAESHQVSDRLVFVGRVPYQDLPRYLGAMDVCLSTQSNDLAGQVRTTGKLPLYLSCGKHVLATRVGEAARVLPDSMLLSYRGTWDQNYPARLASRIRELVLSGAWAREGDLSRKVAVQNFDYCGLAERLRLVLN